VPETNIVHGSVVLVWCCKACNQEWPITNGEQQAIERRKRARDRRRVTRADRREPRKTQ
jgi:hypothetical protein